MTPGQKREIDEMPYESMLRIHRHAPMDDRRFIGEVGSYFADVMKEKRIRIGDEAHTAASKRIGW